MTFYGYFYFFELDNFPIMHFDGSVIIFGLSQGGQSNQNIEESTIYSLFASGYETKARIYITTACVNIIRGLRKNYYNAVS